MQLNQGFRPFQNPQPLIDKIRCRPEHPPKIATQIFLAVAAGAGKVTSPFGEGHPNFHTRP